MFSLILIEILKSYEFLKVVLLVCFFGPFIMLSRLALMCKINESMHDVMCVY